MMNYGWIRVPKNMIDDKVFWDEMEGVFETLEERFSVGGLVHVFGMSDWFDYFSGNKHDAPTYDIIFDHNEEFHGFELSELV